MYRAFGLLQPGSDFTLDELANRLRSRLDGAAVARSDDQITVAQGDWEIALQLNTGPAVWEESIDLAEKIAGLEDGSEIASCDRRVEVWSDTPDPMMEHFNDYILVIEVLQSFRNLIAVDPREPCLM